MGSTESMTNQGAAADLAATPNSSTTNTPANSGLMGSVGIGGARRFLILRRTVGPFRRIRSEPQRASRARSGLTRRGCGIG